MLDKLQNYKKSIFVRIVNLKKIYTYFDDKLSLFIFNMTYYIFLIHLGKTKYNISFVDRIKYINTKVHIN